MECCPIFDIIGDLFVKALQGSQICFYHNIILGICEDDITSYYSSKIVLLEERNIKLEREKLMPKILPKLQATEETKDCVGKS